MTIFNYWHVNMRTEEMIEYADVSQHDIRGHEMVLAEEPVIEWRNSWAGEWDMDDG